MIPQPLIAVADIGVTSVWYQSVLGLGNGHGVNEYEQLILGGRMVMQIHRRDAHEHPFLDDPMREPHGNGAILWFKTDRFNDILERIKNPKTHVLEGPHINRDAHHREIWLRGPNGYVVVVAEPMRIRTSRS
ncbi:VOC family protein [Acidihalobacter prosperus]|uniref:VOC family protein n=1 Tax=Acidihalobacter prosperus TaxID=160660 RepID=UPI0009EE1268|nr:glyoxalase/bleomycin resistance/extradiol dioxygenase family protein [Acidihalobacter prosperus]